MKLNRKQYLNQLLGCWNGKNIGGTLGAPFEWLRQINDVDYYIQEMNGRPLPNDDLDLQLLWLLAMEEKGIDLSADILADYFNIYVTPHWAEYGICKANMKLGLNPPMCGYYNNIYRNSCGAYIRSEIWACLCPGNPTLAAEFMYRDAIIDHGGDSEGLYGAIFCVAMESAAFVEKDPERLVEIGLSYIPKDCGVARAIRYVIENVDKQDWCATRDGLLQHFRSQCVTQFCDDCVRKQCSDEDIKKGFDVGPEGWEAPVNVAIVVLGLLYGKGEFGKSICIAVNCGEDTDCTAATLGALLGICYGDDAIEEKWKKGIGSEIVTACLDLGEIPGLGKGLPQTTEEMVARTECLEQAVELRYTVPVSVDDEETDIDNTDFLTATKYAYDWLYRNLFGPIYDFGNFKIMVDYFEGCEIRSGEERKVRIKIKNCYKLMEHVTVSLRFDDGVSVSPAQIFTLYIPQWMTGRNTVSCEIGVSAEMLKSATLRGIAEIRVIGKCTTMLVPIILINGDGNQNS